MGFFLLVIIIQKSSAVKDQDVQEPLTAHILAQHSPSEQKQLLGEKLYPIIHKMHGDLAGKITAILLECDNAELLHMLESRDALLKNVTERIQWL